MGRFVFAVPVLSALLAISAPGLAGQSASAAAAKPKPAAVKAEIAAPGVAKDLPVRKVVLYKNGVGYFEHSGTVNGTQKVSIDFTSSQLNDVLQSLTVLDEGGGRIGGMNYNSTTPLSEQLKLLSLGMGDDPTSTELFQALRGQRVEVTGAPGGPINGRLMAIETRSEKAAGTGEDGAPNTIDKYYLTVVATSGAVRVVELTPQLSVRPLDANLQGQVDRYLELLSTAHANGLRHLTLNAIGQGARQLRVSYISEVPIWKSTYRMVFPKEVNGKAILQGWAVVDNTVGADWENVYLSLVAGAPQSFIQPLSQPLYVKRVEIPIATEAQTAPQTHEATEAALPQLETMARSASKPRSMRSKSLAALAFGVAGMEGLGGSVAGGVYRASDAIAEGDVETKAFDDYFEYTLAQPITIHKNESAMVPILQQELPAEHVSLWNERSSAPLRAVWLKNDSKLTLDQGSFSIFEGGEFAGEGLLDPVHPGERRLLSYATDKALRVRVTDRHSGQTLHHVSVQRGVLIETRMDESSVTYTATNSGDLDRALLIESPRVLNGWTLDEGIKADETAANVYRFKVQVAAHATAKLEVRQHGPEEVRVELNSRQNQTEYLLNLAKRVPGALDALKPVIDAQTALAKLDFNIAESKRNEEKAEADETRARENLTALKGNEASKRFVTELNRAEDSLQAARKHTEELEGQKQAAAEKLNTLIAGLSYDWDVKTASR